MISLNICISISNGIPTLTVQISMKTDPYSALDKPQKHTLRGRTSGRSFTLSAPINFVSKNGSVFSIDPDMFVNHYLLIPKPKKQVFFSLKKSKFKS